MGKETVVEAAMDILRESGRHEVRHLFLFTQQATDVIETLRDRNLPAYWHASCRSRLFAEGRRMQRDKPRTEETKCQDHLLEKRFEFIQAQQSVVI